MVRIAHFSDAAVDGVNGIAASIGMLTEQLSERGHDNLVVSTGRGGIRVPSLPTGMGDFRFALFPLAPMRGKVRDWRPDLAHVHTPGPLGAAGFTVARELGIPAVYTYHTDIHGYSAFYHFPTPVIRAGTALYARHLPRGAKVKGFGRYAAVEAANARVFAAARIIILPTASALRHCRTAPVYAHKTRVIPTPPGHRAHEPAERNRTPLTPTPPDHRAHEPAERNRTPDIPTPPDHHAHEPAERNRTVLFVGRVSAEKGIPLLLDAMSRLRREMPDAGLVLAGPVARRLRLRRRLARAGLTEHTTVTGVLRGDEVPAAYRAAGVFAFPSTTDTQGLVLHEAALAGLPIVMVDRELAACHPLGEAVRLADPDPASLASALRETLRETLREALREAPRTSLTEDPSAQVARARQIACASTPALFAERTLDAYREALAQPALTGGRG